MRGAEAAGWAGAAPGTLPGLSARLRGGGAGYRLGAGRGGPHAPTPVRRAPWGRAGAGGRTGAGSRLAAGRRPAAQAHLMLPGPPPGLLVGGARPLTWPEPCAGPALAGVPGSLSRLAPPYPLEARLQLCWAGTPVSACGPLGGGCPCWAEG